MYSFRLWIGSLIFAVGIGFWVWFLRNASRKNRKDQARLFKSFHKMIQVIWNSAWVGVGLWVYPIPKTIPLIALLGGVFSGIYFSQAHHKNSHNRNELFRKR